MAERTPTGVHLSVNAINGPLARKIRRTCDAIPNRIPVLIVLLENCADYLEPVLLRQEEVEDVSLAHELSGLISTRVVRF